ncbi:MAG: hypothetical protein HKN29_08080 [Rhodothermales bacterium]|nr:hypothetical protein [Rhodothermales bacterium]
MPDPAFPISPTIGLLVVSAFATGWMTGTCWVRRRQPYVAELGVLAFLAFLWSLLALLYHIVSEPGIQHILLDLRYVPITLIPVAWVVFSWAASGVSELSLRGRVLLLAVPLMTLFLLATNPWHGLVFEGIAERAGTWGVVVGHEFGTWFWVHTAYSYILMGAGTILMGVLLSRSHRRIKPRVALLLAGALAPSLINVVFLANRALFDYVDPSPIGFAVTTLIYGVCVFRFRVLELAPLPSRALFESGSEARLILSKDGRIVNQNRAAEALIPGLEVGKDVRGLVRELWMLRGAEPVRREIRLSEVKTPGWFELEVAGIAIPGPYHHEGRAWLIRLKEIGERKHAQARLESQLLGATERAARVTSAMGSVQRVFEPRLEGIEGLADSLLEDLPEEASGFVLAIRDAAGELREKLAENLEKADATADGAPRRRPSRAPVPRSAEGPRGTDTPEADPIP